MICKNCDFRNFFYIDSLCLEYYYNYKQFFIVNIIVKNLTNIIFLNINIIECYTFLLFYWKRYISISLSEMSVLILIDLSDIKNIR